MPLPLIQFEISMDDFHTMRHRIGWKHEYWDGQAQLSPSSTAIADFQLRIWKKNDEVVQPCEPAVGILRIPEPSDTEELVRLHSEVFESAIEYAGYDEASYHQSNMESIAAFFGQSNRRGYAHGVLAYSRVIEQSGRLIAALLVRAEDADDAASLVVQPIMVAAEHQRHGLGRCLLDAVRSALAGDDRHYLNSRCHLGNEASMAWHRAVGFEEQPSMFAASHRAHHHSWMARHHTAAGRELEAFYHGELAEVNAQLKVACEQIKWGK